MSLSPVQWATCVVIPPAPQGCGERVGALEGADRGPKAGPCLRRRAGFRVAANLPESCRFSPAQFLSFFYFFND